jgi:hypothetical protein
MAGPLMRVLSFSRSSDTFHDRSFDMRFVAALVILCGIQAHAYAQETGRSDAAPCLALQRSSFAGASVTDAQFHPKGPYRRPS